MENKIKKQIFRIQPGDNDLKTEIEFSLIELKTISNLITSSESFETQKRLLDLKEKLWWYITELD